VEYVNLGTSGLKVSRICLGTMMFGGASTDAQAAKIVNMARDAGVNFIDTAESYSGTASERVVGKLLKRDRNAWVVATKTGASPMGPGPNDKGLNRRRLMTAIDQSLLRLKMDHVDVYYLHQSDASTPLEETLGAVKDIIRAGKARYWGFSNFPVWQIGLIAHVCEKIELELPVVCQPYYNAMNRLPEVELLPACQHYGFGVVPYSPLARGVLTGKYDPDEAPDPSTRAGRGDRRILQAEFRKESLIIAKKLKTYAESKGTTPGALAIGWTLNSKAVTSVLPGPRTPQHWRANLAALDYVFTAEDEAYFDSLVPPGQFSTPGFVDPKFPVMGRFPMVG